MHMMFKSISCPQSEDDAHTHKDTLKEPQKHYNISSAVLTLYVILNVLYGDLYSVVFTEVVNTYRGKVKVNIVQFSE